MTLDNVISAAFTLSRQDRQKLFETIAVADGLAITVESGWVGDITAKSNAERLANNRKAYTGEDLVALHEISSRMDTDCSFGEKQQREAIQLLAKRLGRTEKAIAEKIRTMRLS